MVLVSKHRWVGIFPIGVAAGLAAAPLLAQTTALGPGETVAGTLDESDRKFLSNSRYDGYMLSVTRPTRLLITVESTSGNVWAKLGPAGNKMGFISCAGGRLSFTLETVVAPDKPRELHIIGGANGEAYRIVVAEVTATPRKSAWALTSALTGRSFTSAGSTQRIVEHWAINDSGVLTRTVTFDDGRRASNAAVMPLQSAGMTAKGTFWGADETKPVEREQSYTSGAPNEICGVFNIDNSRRSELALSVLDSVEYTATGYVVRSLRPAGNGAYVTVSRVFNEMSAPDYNAYVAQWGNQRREFLEQQAQAASRSGDSGIGGMLAGAVLGGALTDGSAEGIVARARALAPSDASRAQLDGFAADLEADRERQARSDAQFREGLAATQRRAEGRSTSSSLATSVPTDPPATVAGGQAANPSTSFGPTTAAPAEPDPIRYFSCVATLFGRLVNGSSYAAAIFHGLVTSRRSPYDVLQRFKQQTGATTGRDGENATGNCLPWTTLDEAREAVDDNVAKDRRQTVSAVNTGVDFIY